VRERINSSHLSDAEKHDLLTQLHLLRDADIYKIGREALLAEFRAEAVDPAQLANPQG
jgi:hypothetical protein